MDGGGNVWELVEDATFQRSRSHSPSKTSKLSELIATVEEIEQDVDPETLSMVLRDEQHRLAEGGLERKKSKYTSQKIGFELRVDHRQSNR